MVRSADSANQRAVYLTGSHIGNNLHDGIGPGAGCADSPEPFDFDGYLALLQARGHNFIRLWRWEQFQSHYALTNPGQEYLILQPSDTAEAFTVVLEAGTYAVEWHSITPREAQAAGTLTVDCGGPVSLTVTFGKARAAVVYLKHMLR